MIRENPDFNRQAGLLTGLFCLYLVFPRMLNQTDFCNFAVSFINNQFTDDYGSERIAAIR